MEQPSSEDLFVQNACYANCSHSCINHEDYKERRDCMDQCPCHCNTYCYDQCHKAGLDQVCDHICGCNASQGEKEVSPAEEHEEEREVEEEKEEAHEDKEDDKHHENKEEEHQDVEESHDNKEEKDDEDEEKPKEVQQYQTNEEDERKQEEIVKIVNATEQAVDESESEDQESSIVTTTTQAHHGNQTEHEEVRNAEAKENNVMRKPGLLTMAAEQESGSQEFRTLMAKLMRDGNYCKPQCWRKCLQMRENKEKVFKCIEDCGCGDENPQLLYSLEHEESGSLAEPSGHSIVMPLLFLIAILGGVAYYIYKREFENKIEEDLIIGDTEEGYQKLD